MYVANEQRRPTTHNTGGVTILDCNRHGLRSFLDRTRQGKARHGKAFRPTHCCDIQLEKASYPPPPPPSSSPVPAPPRHDTGATYLLPDAAHPAQDLGVRVLHEPRQLVEEPSVVLLEREEGCHPGVLHGQDVEDDIQRGRAHLRSCFFGGAAWHGAREDTGVMRRARTRRNRSAGMGGNRR